MGDGWFAFGEYEAMSEDVGNPCLVCGTVDKDKPMAFRKTDHCCDNHRKVIIGENLPTIHEWAAMDIQLHDHLVDLWSRKEKVE